MREIPFSVPVSGVVTIDEDSATIVVNRAETTISLLSDTLFSRRLSLRPGKTMYDIILEAARQVIQRKGVNRFSAPELYAKALDKYPNFYVDISARDYELGRQPRNAAKFLARYKDRVLFGTDMGREKHMYQEWWRLLETADEYMPGRIWWRYYGLELPAPLLKSLYRDNALRLLNWQKVQVAGQKM